MGEAPRNRAELRAANRSARTSRVRRATGHDLKPSAREWFAILRPLLLASVPREWRAHPHMKNGRGKPLMISVPVGPPTFRNVIDENGQHV